MVSALRVVDEVCVYKSVDEIVQEKDFDVFVVGEDQTHSGFQAAVDWCRRHNKTVIRLSRTRGISSTEMKEKSPPTAY